MAAKVHLKSIGDFGYIVNRYGFIQLDNILASLDSRIDEHFNRIDGNEECDDPRGSKLHGQRWILSSANLKLSPFFNRCKFGSLHDVTIELESKHASLRYFTCKIWPLNRPSEEICTAKMVKMLSSVDNFVHAKQVLQHLLSIRILTCILAYMCITIRLEVVCAYYLQIYHLIDCTVPSGLLFDFN